MGVHQINIPFVSAALPGHIRVEIEPNRDPVDTGHDVAAVGYDRERFLGFPVVTAHTDFTGGGYRAVFGWLQFVVHHYADGTPSRTDLDAWPSLQAHVPLIAMGLQPTFFDAPANPDHPDMRWLAHTYLVRFSFRQPKTLTYLAGFSWGYDLAGGHPTILAPEQTAASDWTTDTEGSDDLVGWELAADVSS